MCLPVLVSQQEIDMDETARVDRLREQAKQQGLYLKKSREEDRRAQFYCGYTLINLGRHKIQYGVTYDLDLNEIEKYLTDNEGGASSRRFVIQGMIDDAEKLWQLFLRRAARKLSEKSRAGHLRKLAKKQNLFLKKSRVRDRSVQSYGSYTLIDDRNMVVYGMNSDLTLDEVDKYLTDHEGAS